MRKATIAGTGMYAPDRVVTNQFFNDLYKKDIGTFLQESRNIRERRWMTSDQTTSDLIIPAAEEAMKNADQVTHKSYRESLQNNQDLIRQSIELATVHKQVPIELDLDALKHNEPNRQLAYALFRELE